MTERACTGCGAPIIWAVTEKGKRIPLNSPAVRDTRGFTLTERHDQAPLAHYVADARGATLYVSHFASCPKAKEFRR